MTFRLDFTDFGADLRDAAVGEQDHLPALEARLRQMPAGAQAVLDLSGVEFLGYAYARQTVAECARRVLDGRYPVRSLSLAYDGEDFEVRLVALEGLLAELRLSLFMRLEPRGELVILGYLRAPRPFEGKREGAKRAKLRRVLQLLIERGELYTNEVARELELTLPNSNYLLGELESGRLVERVKEASPSGGPIYRNRVLAPPPADA